jgi:hypothetical protein
MLATGAVVVAWWALCAAARKAVAGDHRGLLHRGVHLFGVIMGCRPVVRGGVAAPSCGAMRGRLRW